MRQRQTEFDQHRIRICVVTFDAGTIVQNYVKQADWDWPLLIDHDRALYRQYSMGQGGWWSIYGPASIWHYLTLMMRGRMPGQPGSDFRQFGGDILIDPVGIVRMHFVSVSPHDRPSVKEILAVGGREPTDSERVSGDPK